MFNFGGSKSQAASTQRYAHTGRVRFSLGVPCQIPSELLRNEGFLGALAEMRDDIYDLNFTCHLPPFLRDAYGVFQTPMQAQVHARDLLRLQERTGIRVSALFNNIYVPPTKENLHVFVESLRPLYEAGLRSATVPHTLWMKWGELQREFPELFIKNTVLREVRSGQDFWNAALAGFGYVNLHRIVARDRPTLQEIRRAQAKFAKDYGKTVLISLLNGEGCQGSCPLWQEHYQHTLQHPDTDDPDRRKEIFATPITVGCRKFDADPQAKRFSAVNLSPFRDDLEELLEYVDVLKMGSRNSPDDFSRLLSYVRMLKTRIRPDAPPGIGEPEVQPGTPQAKMMESWRRAIKVCRFQCWNCSICTEMQLLFDANIGR